MEQGLNRETIYRSWRRREPGLGIERQIGESYQALHQPPGSLTAGAPARHSLPHVFQALPHPVPDG